MSELRPISLCNVVYKVVSKVLANRLKKVLNEVISETQSAFIPGRLITDNIMISYEVMHYMKRKTKEKTGWMALKLDMSKAYDRVEWGFLRAMLVKLGFDIKVVKLFMECVTSVRYKISHAGKEFGLIVPESGIRQGDPLSSYLFLICMEGFTALIHDYERMSLIKGIQVARGAPFLSHMFFADDSYIYCKAKREAAAQVINMLNMYEKASGQKLNVEKSSIFFSRNTEQGVRNELCNILQFHEAGENTKYLGLPNMLGRNKSAVLGYLKERLQDRIQGWDKKLLSKGGKEILLKTVAQALPNYAMSMFLLPIQLCTDMERLMCKFWWKSSTNKERGIHWMSWERMSKKKMSGGLGFRKLHDFNVALLGKQGWRLITSPESLVSKIYKARYYPDGSFLSAKAGANPSYIWRSILEAQVLLKQGAVRRIGSGNSVDILHDPWLPQDNDPYVHTIHEALNGRSVASLMIPGENQWDVDLINDIFIERYANLILSIPLRRTDMDSWYWRMEKMGQYTVKSAYAAIQASGEVNHSNVNSDFWRKLWNLKIPPKVKNFLWRALTGCLPTKDQLLVKKFDVNATCPVCNIDPENVLHILVLCPFASLCWVKVGCRNEEREYTSFIDWMNESFQKHTGDAMKTISMVCWSIWKNRNEIVWNQKGVEFTEVVESALLVLNQWKSAQDRSFDNSLGFMTQADGDEHWERPPEGIVKVNTDAALFEESNCYSYSMLARNHGGDLMEAVSCCRQGSIAPELAEAIGIREALSWVKTKVWPKVVVETDCLLITQAVRCSSVNLSYIGRVVDECKQLLSELRDRNVTLKFVKRSANKVAHYLARYNSSVADRVWKGGDIHLEFFQVLLVDLKF